MHNINKTIKLIPLDNPLISKYNFKYISVGMPFDYKKIITRSYAFF